MEEHVLDRLIHRIGHELIHPLRKELHHMTMTIQDLDNAVNSLVTVDTNLATAVQDIVDDVNILLAEIANSPAAVDFQAEVDKVNASATAAQAAIDALKASDLLAHPQNNPQVNPPTFQ